LNTAGTEDFEEEKINKLERWILFELPVHEDEKATQTWQKLGFFFKVPNWKTS